MQGWKPESATCGGVKEDLVSVMLWGEAETVAHGQEDTVLCAELLQVISHFPS